MNPGANRAIDASSAETKACRWPSDMVQGGVTAPVSRSGAAMGARWRPSSSSLAEYIKADPNAFVSASWPSTMNELT